jgi:acyl-coenzyme A synthetase/AMP-(fatty) acid ligase
VGDGWSTRYEDLLAEVARWDDVLGRHRFGPGRVAAFEVVRCDRDLAMLLAIAARGGIAVPLGPDTTARRADYLRASLAEFTIDGSGTLHERGSRPAHALLDKLIAGRHPGLILFTSGSTGMPKAILHDTDRLLRRYASDRPRLRILSFLLTDHIGGLNTLFHALAQGGTAVGPRDRSVGAVCEAIARHQVEVLPTTPSFLNLMLLSGEYRRHDLSSLRLITYGTEPMPASTLSRLRLAFPGVRLKQTYGLSELGIPGCESRGDDSLWVRLGGDGFETRVVDGVLWVRSAFAMLGYLDSPSPFDPDGWFNTQDLVVQEGDWLRIVGRVSEVINTGGRKVHPAEVESVLLEMENVADVAVRGADNPLLGQCVVARVSLVQPEPAVEFRRRMRSHCRGRLEPHMVPAWVELVEGCLTGGGSSGFVLPDPVHPRASRRGDRSGTEVPSHEPL